MEQKEKIRQELTKQVEKQKQDEVKRREQEIVDFKKSLKMMDENKKKEDQLRGKKMEVSLKIGADMIGQLQRKVKEREI